MFDILRSFSWRRAAASRVVVVLLFACLGCGPDDPVAEAKAYIDKGRARAAIELLEPVVRMQRDNLDAQYYYGVALTMVGEGGLAEWSLRRAMKDPDPERSKQAALMIVSNALQGSNPLEAAKILSDMLEDDPENIHLLLARATAYAQTRINLDAALADVERVRELDPSNLDFYRPEILGYLAAVMTEEAAASLDALGKRLEEEPEAETMGSWYCTTMALFAMESGEKELARERFDGCVDEHPADIKAVSAATKFLRKEQEIDRAIEILERAMTLYEGRSDSGFAAELADLFLQQGRVEEAEALMIEAAESENLQTSLRYTLQLSRYYESQGRIDEALEAFEKAVVLMADLRARTESAEFSLADLAIRSGDLDRALEVAAALDHPPFRFMIEARVAQAREDHTKAISLYQEAARLWPDNEYARYHAARSAEQIGDFDAAIELYRHATRISVDTTNGMSRIAVLLYTSGHRDDAIRVLRQQQGRADLDEIGEVLKLEMTVLAGGSQRIFAYLSKLPETDSIGIAPRLASVFRALRFRREPAEAIRLASRMDPEVFAEPGGDRALAELARAAGGRADILDRVNSILDAAIELAPESGGLQAVRGVLAEERGESQEVIAAAYDAALELDPNEPLALLGRARGLVDADADAKESLALGKRALEADSVDTQRVTDLAVQLMNSGARTEALELFRLALKQTPYDGRAAQALATARLASGDHSDRTLDFARRAARFARSERSLILLRDTYEARGEQARADEIIEALGKWKQGADEEAEATSSGSAAG